MRVEPPLAVGADLRLHGGIAHAGAEARLACALHVSRLHGRVSAAGVVLPCGHSRLPGRTEAADLGARCRVAAAAPETGESFGGIAMSGGEIGMSPRHLAHPALGAVFDPEVSQVSQSVAGRCDTQLELVSAGSDTEKLRSVASVARFSAEMMESREESGSVVTKQQHGKFASGDSASPATLSGVLRHLRQLSRHQADQRLTRAKCRKTRCDSVATLATLARQRSGRRS